MAKSPKVLHVIHSLDPSLGGMSEGLKQICAAHERLGHEFKVVAMDDPQSPWLKDFPAEVRCFGPLRTKYGYTPDLVPWIRNNAGRYDATVVHGLWQFHSLATHRALLDSPVPYYVFPHGMLDPWFKRANRLKHLKKAVYWRLIESHVLNDARGVLFTTDDEARLAPQTFSANRWRGINVGFGIDPPRDLHPRQIRKFIERWPECRSKRLVLFLSRIHLKKGCDLLIDAFAGAALRDQNLHLVIAGPDDAGLRPQLEAQARALGVAHRITWTGMLTGDEKWGALQAAEVFALFSHQENFGVAVVEALAIGLPVLITHPINISAAIASRGAGFVDDDTRSGATRLIHRWLDTSGSERESMGERATECFKSLFHSDAATARLVGEISAR
jgi:glycosyltransferase involved in cell wall biosynthesis